MDDRDYIKKEAEILYKYIIDDREKFDNKKQIYARIYNSIKGSVSCQIGGLEYLEITTDEIKSIIRDVVDNSNINININIKIDNN